MKEMNKSDQNRAIVFTVSKNLIFSVACVMKDIKRLSPNLAHEVVILHDGIKNSDMELISSILPTRFIEYEMPFDDISFIPDSILDYFTKMVFAKFECLKLLRDYKSVMLLDYDIIIQKDISELFDYCASGIRMMLHGSNVRAQLHRPINDYNMNLMGVSAGTFVFHDHIGDFLKMYDFCYSCLKTYARELYLPEQAIFDFMIQEFNLTVTPMDPKIYSPHPNDKTFAKEAKIIHAYGQPKFWNGLHNDHWQCNYNEWLRMGGSGYKKNSTIMFLLKKITRKIKLYLT
jgi:lipopolysaccharide biosynthesis glycosyltransferase